MLRLVNLSKRFDLYSLFKNVNLSLSVGQKVGLIGPSGSGKSTLIRILMGLESYQNGEVYISPLTWFGYLPQNVRDGGHGQTVGDVFQKAIQDFCLSKPLLLTSRSNGNSHRSDTASRNLTVRQECWDIEQISHEVKRGLELEHLALSYKVDTLDSREQRMVCLAALLIACPSMLALDEPTKYLSISACEWLEGFLRDYVGTFIVVSSDRHLLDGTVNTIWEIVPRLLTIREHQGNYATYLTIKK